MKPKSIIVICMGCVVTGVLMGWRDSFDSAWMRAVMAGCAGAILAFSYGVANMINKGGNWKNYFKISRIQNSSRKS
jgi:hypothetical protein